MAKPPAFDVMLRALAEAELLPRRWRLPCMAAAGACVGLGLAVAHISRAHSYLNDEPETCMNCHVMNPQFATWQHSSHRETAVCNDCHVPHDNFIRHYFFKAADGAKHSTIFTMRTEPQVIRLSKAAVPVVEANCRRCHAEVLQSVRRRDDRMSDLLCWHCHQDVPHSRGRSLAAAPRIMTPKLPPVLPGGATPLEGDDHVR